MKESQIKFTKPTLESIDFKVNGDFKKTSESIDIINHLENKVEEIDSTSATVYLRFYISSPDSGELPFYLDATIKANFKWPSDLSEEVKKSILNYNAPALLLGYLRPIVAYITGVCTQNQPYNIPFIDFKND